MRKKIESIINNSLFYNPIRFNPISDFIIETSKKKTSKTIIYYSSFLDIQSQNKLIFDIGANKGNKVKAFLKMGFKVIAVEPEKKALSTLRWRFGKNKRVTIVGKGVSDQHGSATIHIAESRSGLNTLSDKWVNSLETETAKRGNKKPEFKKNYQIELTTLANLYAEYGTPYFIKIDVEGFENKVIKGMKQLPAFISFETNLPEFREESIECIQHLLGLSSKLIFNYSIGDKLESPKWLSAQEIIGTINNPEIRYMEIICDCKNVEM